MSGRMLTATHTLSSSLFRGGAAPVPAVLGRDTEADMGPQTLTGDA